jgi:hypothetical protein
VEFVKQLLEEEKNSLFQNALHQKQLDPQRNQQLKEIRRKFKVFLLFVYVCLLFSNTHTERPGNSNVDIRRVGFVICECTK